MGADDDARRRICDDLDSTLVVEAAAGTGKTTALVRRIASVLGAGLATLDGLVAVTFTEKAAGEMKLRLRAEIERSRIDAPTDAIRVRFERALAELELAQIATIHSFCADLLRERPLEAEVDPDFQIVAEEEESTLLQRAVDQWFEEALEDPPEGLARFLRRAHREGPRTALVSACHALAERRDHAHPFARPDFDRRAMIDDLLVRLAALATYAAAASNDRDPLLQCLRAVERVVTDVTAAERPRPGAASSSSSSPARDYDGVEAALVDLARTWYGWKNKGWGTYLGPGALRQVVIAERDDVKRRLDELAVLVDADLAALLHDELRIVLDRYEELKRSAGVLDFIDLLLAARDLLRRDRGIRAELQTRFRRIFVDEFQDTDPIQADIILLLSGSDPGQDEPDRIVVTPGKLFVVGDPKQAIYGFRRADVATYERVKRHLIDGGASLLYLTTSFRAGPTIQSVVNRAFSAHMQAQRANTESAGGQADYVPLAPHRPDPTERPSVVALPVPDVLTEYGAVSKAKIRQHTPGVVASFVRWLVEESGWTVTDPAAGREVPVETRHVCLLFRRVRSYGNDVTEPYIRALEARRIAHVMVGGSSFHQREEVIAIRSALQAVEWPDDELMVYAALHGPFFALDDADLLAFRSQVGRLHPLVPIADVHRETCPAVAGALEVLRDLHYRRNRVPIADTVSQLLERTRAHAAIAYWTSGEQALANVLRIVDDAHRFEVRAGTSFRLFLDWLDDQATRGRDRQAPVVEEGSEGVRLMTVHSAKGLEFPVVVLCDPTVPRLNTKPSHHVDHARGLWAESIVGCAPLELLEHAAEVCAADDAEEIRVTYVAATRARDLLVVPAIEDARAAGWVDVLHDALYRPRAAEAGKVVWWSAPSGLGRAARARPGVWRTKLLAAAERSAEGIEVYRAWAEHRTVVRARAARPSLVARTVTAMSEEGKVGAAIDVQRTDAQRSGRPRGKRFGTLVHAILGELDLAAPEVEAMAHIQGRLLGAPASEIDAAIDAVHRALAHPLLARAKASSDCRRETPIVHRAANGTLVEGVVDLAFLDDDRWIVVDFKTDERGDDEKYAAQVRYYTEAISAATGCDATGVLFLV